MKLTDEQYKQIADDLLCGMVVIVEKSNGNVDSYPAGIGDHLMFDEENPYQDIIDKVENNWQDYIEISPMQSSESFNIMERFADGLEESELKKQVFRALQKRKPFRNFKDLVEYSDHREKWFEFQLQEHIEYAKRHFVEDVED
jgi:hypothetical protein